MHNFTYNQSAQFTINVYRWNLSLWLTAKNNISNKNSNLVFYLCKQTQLTIVVYYDDDEVFFFFFGRFQKKFLYAYKKSIFRISPFKECTCLVGSTWLLMLVVQMRHSLALKCDRPFKIFIFIWTTNEHGRKKLSLYVEIYKCMMHVMFAANVNILLVPPILRCWLPVYVWIYKDA